MKYYTALTLEKFRNFRAAWSNSWVASRRHGLRSRCVAHDTRRPFECKFSRPRLTLDGGVGGGGGGWFREAVDARTHTWPSRAAAVERGMGQGSGLRPSNIVLIACLREWGMHSVLSTYLILPGSLGTSRCFKRRWNKETPRDRFCSSLIENRKKLERLYFKCFLRFLRGLLLELET